MSAATLDLAPLYEVRAEDEGYHGIAAGHGFTASETNYFGFSIPEHRINAEVYLWAHPHFEVAAGGVLIYQGVKRQPLEADYLNYFSYQPMPKDFTDYELPVGLKVEIDPLKTVRVRYTDSAAETEFDVTLTGLTPPCGRPGGGHFTQPCKTAGRLVLRGREYPIDGYFSRDHSWLLERAETRRRTPPVTWMVGVFGDDLAFHTVGPDDFALHPEWREWEPALADHSPFGWGYLVEGGEVIQLADYRNKITSRAADGVTPLGYELDIVDVRGRTHHVEGKVRAGCPFFWWPNMVTHMSQVEWRLNDRVGYGDCQDIQFNDWAAAFVRS